MASQQAEDVRCYQDVQLLPLHRRSSLSLMLMGWIVARGKSFSAELGEWGRRKAELLTLGVLLQEMRRRLCRLRGRRMTLKCKG
jgi:hypothetical protein